MSSSKDYEKVMSQPVPQGLRLKITGKAPYQVIGFFKAYNALGSLWCVSTQIHIYAKGATFVSGRQLRPIEDVAKDLVDAIPKALENVQKRVEHEKKREDDQRASQDLHVKQSTELVAKFNAKMGTDLKPIGEGIDLTALNIEVAPGVIARVRVDDEESVSFSIDETGTLDQIVALINKLRKG